MTAKAARALRADLQEWVPLLEVAAREVFELMMGSRLSVAASARRANLDVTSMVGLAGRLCGVLSVHCDGKTAALMASKMLHVVPEKVGPEVSDAIGEVCNMVAGNFKNKVPGLGDGCMLSPPTVITGSDYSLRSLGTSPIIQLGLMFEKRPLVISLQVDS
jgi:chemotaxis protein CheX